MKRREVKKLTIEFEDGETETVEVPGIFYRETRNFPGGGHPREDRLFMTYEVHWAAQ